MMMMMTQLEDFIDESIERSAELDHTPVRFLTMRNDAGTLQAIKMCVCRDEETSGFTWAKENGLLEWTLEAAALKFAPLFDRLTLAYAKARLGDADFIRNKQTDRRFNREENN